MDTREDVSDFLFHFTKGSNPQMTLQKILQEGKLVAGDCGYICFTEAPITMLPKMVEYFAEYEENAKFASYGLGFRKDFLFYKGARPVIYSDYGEMSLLAPSIQWRHQDYHPIVHKQPWNNPKFRDYTWMREWRLPVKEFSFNERQCIVVTKDSWENILYQEFEPMDNIDDIPYWIRKYKNISFQDITESGSTITKQKLMDILSNQEFGELVG